MAEDRSRQSLAAIVAHMASCPPNACALLTTEQINDFYYFKHRLVASLHRLYTKVPETEADDIIAGLLEEILAEFRNSDG